MPFEPSPAADLAFRKPLLEHYLESQSATGLADWLRGLGQDPSGSVAERMDRIRANTRYLGMAARDFPQQTENYLAPYTAADLADLCSTLGLPDGGTKDQLYRRILREVGYREGWLPRLSPDAPIEVSVVARFLAWYPVVKWGSYEKDYYPSIEDELSELFGNDRVHSQRSLAHGTTLKIDFHVGHPQCDGVGIEVKLPTNNSEVQRGLGQVDQYVQAYGANLVFLLIPDFLDSAAKVLMTEQLTAKGVTIVVKSRQTSQRTAV